MAEKLSRWLFLANSASRKRFSSICQTGFISSQQRLARAAGIPPNPSNAEAALGTSDQVFFYLASFRYPTTSCGLLFSGTLELEETDEGVATPFDSGALHAHLTRPNPAESASDFLARHNLPIPDHRQYLERSLRLLFHAPEDYLNGVDPHTPGPLGLTSGDARRWTHEVRIPDRVFLRTNHLQAVFAARPVVAASRDTQALFKWCANEGVDTVTFDQIKDREFVELEAQSLEYLRKRLY
jgi:hypothetical protein